MIEILIGAVIGVAVDRVYPQAVSALIAKCAALWAKVSSKGGEGSPK